VKEAQRRTKNTAKDTEECWNRFLQAAVKTSAERYNWDLLNWEGPEGCENNYHCLLILKYKKVSKVGPETASLNFMALHTNYSQGLKCLALSFFLLGTHSCFSLDWTSLWRKNLPRSIKHENTISGSVFEAEAIKCRKSTQENNRHMPWHILKAQR